jgi:hypothetical protein
VGGRKMTREQMIEEMGRIYEALEEQCFTYKDELGKMYYSSIDGMWYTDPPTEIDDNRIQMANLKLISDMKIYLKTKLNEYEYLSPHNEKYTRLQFGDMI